MDFSSVCRTCLSDSSLNPIFLNLEEHSRYSTLILITTGLKVTLNDGLPQNMCTDCINYLNNSLRFRKTCKDAETQLLAIKNTLKQSKNDIIPSRSGRESKQFITFEIKNDIDEIKSNILNLKEVTPVKTDSDNHIPDDDDKPLKYLVEKEFCNNSESLTIVNDPERGKQGIDVTNQVSKEGSTDDLSKEKVEDIINTADSKPPYQTTDETSNRVICQLCQKNLSIRSVAAHLARRHPGADLLKVVKVKCELCDSLVRKEKMNRHRKLMHGSETALRCGYCKTEFENKEILINHVTSCTAKKKTRKASQSSRQLRECDICHKTMQKASLRMHKAIKHAGLGPVCEHCGRRFGNKFRLSEHYRAKHGYDKFKCEHCDFQSASIMAMRNHLRRHRGEKPFVCEECGAKFHAAYLLAQHKQSHRTEKLVKCDLCPASFKARNSLHMHKLTCHSTSLFKCFMCARAYACRHYAVKHMRNVHDYRGPVPQLQRVSSEVDNSATEAV